MRKGICAAFVLTLAANFAFACMWDYDTLRQERSRFPTTLEILTGKFLRHSNEFYEWRIQDRLKKLEKEPGNLSWLDDLAVAYDKTGQVDKAIETILKKNKFKEGVYETESNLAVFLFHAGKLNESIQALDRALKINPDAHFGREVYQKYLTEFVLAKMKDGKLPLPMSQGDDRPGRLGPKDGFYPFVASKTGAGSVVGRQRAIKGVLGMMRFAKHDAPVLLEVLGNLLGDSPFGEEVGDAKRLAARAYLKASYEVEGEESKKGYRLLAESILKTQTTSPQSHQALPLELLEKDFKEELEDGTRWYQQLKEKELQWIRDGKNPEAEFDKLYDKDPVADSPDMPSEGQLSLVQEKLVRWLILVASVLVIIFLYFTNKFLRKNSARYTIGGQ